MYNGTLVKKVRQQIKPIVDTILKNSRKELLEYWHFMKVPNCSKTAQLYLNINKLYTICQISSDQTTMHYADADDIILLDKYRGIDGGIKIRFRDFVQHVLPTILCENYTVAQRYLKEIYNENM